MQEVLVRVRTQGWPGTPTPEDHGLTPQEVGREACVQLPTWGRVGTESGEEGPLTILSQRPWQAPILPVATQAWASPTYKGAGEGTAGLMWASPSPTFHTARLQAEHMLGEREGGKEGCHLGKQH